MIIPNERKYVEQILQSKIKPPKMGIRTLICYVAKYYFSECKQYKPKQFAMYVLGKIAEFEFPLATYQEYKYVKSTTNYCRKLLHEEISTQMREIDEVIIPQKELDQISKLDDDKQKKVLFTLYVLARINTHPTGWVNYSTKDIFDLADVKVTSKDRYAIIHELYKHKYIRLNMIIDKHGYFVTLSKDQTPGMMVNCFENLGKQYIVHERPEYFICQHCKKLVKKKSANDHSSKYCDKCGELVNKEKTKDRMAQIRLKAKSPESLDFTESNAV